VKQDERSHSNGRAALAALAALLDGRCDVRAYCFSSEGGMADRMVSTSEFILYGDKSARTGMSKQA